MPLTPGTRLGPYEIVTLIGAGGMGEVYEARDVRLNRSVALKVLPFSLVANDDRRRRFIQEAQLASALQHPHIVTIHDIGSAPVPSDASQAPSNAAAGGGDVEYLAMELVRGRTLRDVIPNRGLRLNEALRYGIQIADALAAAHAAGVVHRDLKPGNIMVTDQGQIKVLDFGLATLTAVDSSSGAETTKLQDDLVQTDAGTILGTVAYMSPEQAEGKPVDARSDIFSFGAILYEMLSGQRAFRADSTPGVLAAVISRDPEPLSAGATHVPPAVDRVVSRCLRKDLARRTQHASDLKVALEDLQEDSSSGALDAASAPVAARRRRWIVPVATAGIVGVGVLVAAAAWWRRTPAPAPAAVFDATPFTSLPGSESSPTFSPDGRQIAFQWGQQQGKPPDVYVQLTTGGTPLRLTHDGNHGVPSWSPDGTAIAIWTLHLPTNTAKARLSLDLISPLGGPAKEVTEADLNNIDRIGWSPDGTWLAFSEANGTNKRGILLVAPATGARVDWAALDPAFADSYDPAFAPDGRRIAYVRSTGDLTDDLYVVAVGPDGKPAGHPTLLDGKARARAPVWSADGASLLVLAGNPTSNGGLARIRADGSGGVEPLGGLRYATSFALSRDGRQLVFSRGGLDAAIWRMDLQDPPRSGVILPSTLSDGNAAYSPDGHRVAFTSNRSGATQVWVADVSGDNAQALTTFDGPAAGTLRWSPDGRRIAFDATLDDNADIFVVPAAGGPVQQLTKTPGEDARPAWSADGRAIYFSSDRSGRREIWRMAADGRDPVQITRQGGQAVLASPDGQLLYYTRPGGGGIYQSRLDGSGGTVVADTRGGSLSFDVTGSGLWFLGPRSNGPGVSLRRLRFADHRVVDMATLDWQPRAIQISVSPDEHSALVTKPDLSGTDLWLVKDFH